jgi:hypothetical protein
VSDGKQQGKNLPPPRLISSVAAVDKAKNLDRGLPALSGERLESLIENLSMATAHLYNTVPP